MKRMNSLLVKGFQASKCKTQLRLGTSRIKLLRNKKGIQIASDRREVAEFLKNGQENNARLLVEHIILEQNLIEAFDLLYLFAERIAAQLSIIDSQKTCPPDLKEDISTLLYASSRCAELPDFAQIRPMFVSKYGKEFVSAATDLRPGSGVNGKVIEKLSANGGSGEEKLKLMKDIAAEHNVAWNPAPFEKEIRVVRHDVHPGLAAFTTADTESMDDFPAVPSRKPSLAIHASQPDNFSSSPQEKFVKGKVEPTNSPRPDDHRTDPQGMLPRRGPPSRKAPGRDESRVEDLKFHGGHPDIDPGSRDTQPRRNPRRESDSFLAPSPQRRYEVEESRRASIGVPSEKSARAHSGSAYVGMGESLPHDYKKYDRRDSQGAGVDELDDASHRKGYSRRDSQGAGIDEFDDASHRKGYNRRDLHGAGVDEFDDASHRKGYDRRDSQGAGYDEASHRKHSDRREYEPVFVGKEGSGKGRPLHQDQYVEEDNLRKSYNRDGSGSKTHLKETSVDEGSRGRINSRDKDDKPHSVKNHRHAYSDDDADIGPHRSDNPRRRESTSNSSKYSDEDNYNPDWDGEHFRNSVTTRAPRNAEDEYRESEKHSRRDSLTKRTSAEDMSKKSNHPALPMRESPRYPNERSISEPLHFDSSEDEHDSRRGSARKPEPRHNDFRPVDTRNSNRPSETREEGSHKGTRRNPRLSSVEEQWRAPVVDDHVSSRGRRPGREDSAPVKTSKPSNADYDEYSDEDRLPTSSRSTSYTDDKRMSLPSGSAYDRVKYQGNRPDDDADGSVRRRATIGAEEIRLARARESEELANRYGEREKQSEIRKQSAPSAKVMQDDGSVGRHSRDTTDRRRSSETLAGYDDRPPRFSSQVDEFPSNTQTQKERSDRHRKVETPARYDDGAPPRFIKDLDDEEPASPGFRGDKPQRFIKPNNDRRSNLQSAKTDPELSSTPRTTSDHRKSHSAFAESNSSKASKAASTAHPQHKASHEDTPSLKPAGGQPQPKPTFMKPPDLDSLIVMFGKNKGKK